MGRQGVWACGAAVLAMLAGQAQAETAAATDPKLGSVHVRCDGQPASVSSGELLARLLLITASAGLAGGGETADTKKRLSGAEAITACDAALAQEKEPTRRVQLTLARAIHQIEVKNYEAALTDARSVPTAAGDKAQERGFQRGLMLSGLELEAASLVRLGRPAEAEAAALKMAAAAPYDLVNMLRVSRYVGLTDTMSPAKQVFFDRYVRMWPTALVRRAEAREWTGDFAGSAADIEALTVIVGDFLKDDQPNSPAFPAKIAVAYGLAGDMARSNALAAQARATVDEMVRSGKALNEQNTVSQTEELLDFQSIVRAASEGRMAEARAAFAARTHWLTPTAPAVALLTQKLRDGAKPAELTGPLARDPATLRAQALAARAGAIIEDAKAVDVLYGAIRNSAGGDPYSGLSRAVWKTDKSRYIIKRNAKDTYKGELLLFYGVYGPPAGEALLLHCALLAQSRGKTGFLLSPGRSRLDSAQVLFGNPGEPGFPRGVTMEAAPVILALSEDMPQPAPSR
jgi:hypothetical protein